MAYGLNPAIDNTLTRIFDYMPDELVVMIAQNLNPDELFTFMLTSKTLYTLILARSIHFVNFYRNISVLPVENLLWSYNSGFINISNLPKLFIRTLGVYIFAKTNQVEETWDCLKLSDAINHEWRTNYGPLPENENDLRELKIKAGMFNAFIKPDDELTLNQKDINAMYAYSSESLSMFKFFFCFLQKYTKIALDWCEFIENDIYDLVHNRNMTFEMFEEQFIHIASTNLDKSLVYRLIRYNISDKYMRLVSYNVDIEDAHDTVEDLDIFEDVNITDNELEVYNSIRHIIGNKLAYYFVIEKHMNIDTIPNFLENVRINLDVGITDVFTIEEYILNPPGDHLMNFLHS